MAAVGTMQAIDGVLSADTLLMDDMVRLGSNMMRLDSAG